MAQIDQFFQKMVALGASDLHLTTGAPPLVRLHGGMKPLSEGILSAKDTQNLIFEILTEKQKKQFIQD